MEESLELLPLHNNPQFTEDCKEILNKEWPRSQTIRDRCLNSSCDELPTNLVLVKRDKTTTVIGHSRITHIPNDSAGFWVESVVINSLHRGKGYGRILMTETEEFAASLGLTTCYLSTIDQQGFYLKLGYEFCPPVCIYGGVINKNLIPRNFLFYPENNNDRSHCTEKLGKKLGTSRNNSTEVNRNSNDSNSVSVPPPPPPPPPIPSFKKEKSQKVEIKRVDFLNQKKLYMKKMLNFNTGNI